MSPTFRDAPAVLARHGVPPDADAETLLAELAARGWEATVEELEAGAGGRGRRAPRFRALAIRPRDVGGTAYGWHDHRRASGRTPAAALARVLAAVLEREA